MTKSYALECVVRATLALITNHHEAALERLELVVKGMNEVKQKQFGFDNKSWED